MKARFIAALVHLLFSALLVGSFCAIALLLWFPGPLSLIEDLSIPIKVMVGVDVVIGPLLTFVVFKLGKRTLKMDLAVILVIQLVAFGYGAWTIWNVRPAVLAWDTGNVYVIRQADLADASLPDWVEPVYGWYGPGLVYVEAITDPAFIQGVLTGKHADVMSMPEQYRPIGEHMTEIQASAVDTEALVAMEKVRPLWQALASDREAGSVLIFAMLGSHGDGMIVLDRESGALVAMNDSSVLEQLAAAKFKAAAPPSPESSGDSNPWH